MTLSRQRVEESAIEKLLGEGIVETDDYEKALALMNKYPESQHFVGARSETVGEAAEKRLDLKFPPSYRTFVLEFGAGNFGAFEVYGADLVDVRVEYTVFRQKEINKRAQVFRVSVR